MAAQTPVVLSLTEAGRALAARLAPAIEGVAQHRGADFDDVGAHLRALFLAGRPILGVCAAGILIRALAPVLASKREEPPVLALSADGATVAPLLGGHRGANALARRAASALGAHAALTTASEARGGAPLDAPPEGWRLTDPTAAKAAMAAVASGAEVVLRAPATLDPTMAAWAAPLLDAGAAREVGDGDHVELNAPGVAPLRYAPRRLALGVGCARGCPPEEVAALVAETLASIGRSGAEVAVVASLDLKSDEAAVTALAADLDAPARFFDAAALEAEADRLATPSEVVFAEVGCHGVAEGAALAAAGPEARLIAPKRKTAHATCAAALAPEPILSPPGRARGRLSVVGIGPGGADWRTPEASRLIAEAEELVGYGLYIDLLGPLGAAKPRADFPLGGEEDRCRYALERAGDGRDVALVCSGDAAIYAMAALVMELIDRGAGAGGVSDAARRAEVVVAPGVSALQAASARAGALIGHDFCAISLSDLLTPREDIVMRLRAAADGDFVIAFYNPVSKRRRTLLAEAREILLTARPAETPVLLASNVGRPEERLTRRTLATLTVEEVDMLTVVLVGSSRSRVVETGDGGWRLYTPRGYDRKRAQAASEPTGAAGPTSPNAAKTGADAEKGRETGTQTGTGR